MEEQIEGKFNEQEMTEFVCKGIKDAISARVEFDKLVDQWYADWRDIKGVKLFPWKYAANFSVPITSTTTDSIIPRIIEGVFDIDPPIQVRALNMTSDKQRDIIKAFIIWDIQTHPELHEQIWYWVQNMCWGGTSFIKNYMEMERKIDSEVLDSAYMVLGEIAEDPKTGEPLIVNDRNTKYMELLKADKGIEYVIEKDVTRKLHGWKKYAPSATTIDIKDCIFPADSESVEDAFDNSFVAVRMWRTKNFLRRQLKQDKKELYKNLDKIKIKGLEGKRENAKDDRERAQIDKYSSKSNKLEFFEVYFNYDVDGDGLDEKMVGIWHLESKALCGYEPYDYKHGECPVIDGKIKPIHKQPFGVGIPEMLFDIKGELDATHNQRTDRGSLYNNPTFVYTAESGYNPNIHKSGPGRKWKVTKKTDDAMGYMPLPDAAQGSYQEEELLLQYAQKRSGSSDYLQNEKVAKQATSSGIQALLQEGNVGFRNFIRWVSLPLGKLFRQRLALYQQYWGNAADEEVEAWVKEILDIPDNPLRGQTMDAIKGQFNIVMTASSQDKKAEMQKASIIGEIINSNPVLQQLYQRYPMKMREIVISQFRTLGINEPDKLIPTEDEIKQWAAEIQKMAMQEMEQEKAEANINEAGKRGYDTEKLRLEAQGGG